MDKLESPWRQDFPALRAEVNDKPLIYLDTAASAQTPTPVLECMNHFYSQEYATVHRGIHSLSSKATQRMEECRSKIAEFINAPSSKQIIFTKGATEGINLVANSYLKGQIDAGDEIIVSEMEHHANIVLGKCWPLSVVQTSLYGK